VTGGPSAQRIAPATGAGRPQRIAATLPGLETIASNPYNTRRPNQDTSRVARNLVGETVDAALP